MDHNGCNFILDTICMTTDNHACNIPFIYQNYTFITCIYLRRTDLPPGSLWCPIDADDEENSKSAGICQENCPKSNYVCK